MLEMIGPLFAIVMGLSGWHDVGLWVPFVGAIIMSAFYYDIVDGKWLRGRFLKGTQISARHLAVIAFNRLWIGFLFYGMGLAARRVMGA
jgi:hypothetical protein